MTPTNAWIFAICFHYSRGCRLIPERIKHTPEHAEYLQPPPFPLVLFSVGTDQCSNARPHDWHSKRSINIVQRKPRGRDRENKDTHGHLEYLQAPSSLALLFTAAQFSSATCFPLLTYSSRVQTPKQTRCSMQCTFHALTRLPLRLAFSTLRCRYSKTSSIIYNKSGSEQNVERHSSLLTGFGTTSLVRLEPKTLA